MTGIRDVEEISERAFVKDMPDGMVRALISEPWVPYKANEELSPVLLQRHLSLVDRLLLLKRLIWSNLAEAANREIARGIFFLLFPVFMGIGAIVYFTLSFEPGWLPVVSIFLAIGISRFVFRKYFLPAQLLTLIMALLLGIVAGKFETEWRATQILGSEVATRITGRVVALEYRDNGSWRVTLDLLETERPTLRYAPQRIRITARDIPASTTIGRGLTGFARLRVPSGPVRPGNYDFAFHAYFSGIGANGFFLGTPKIVNVLEPDGMFAQVAAAIAGLRVHVSERIAEVLSGEDGSVAAALIAGERAGISEETNEDLRKAGLAHILSISGLHMVLAAGVVMMSLRSLFALFPAFSARYAVKKYAAFISLLSCTFYLGLSGADVAAQRSYVMIVVMLCAVLVDRAAISMRNLSIAFVAMVAISPHEILGPSFQMSFSATAGLIAAFAWWSERKARQQTVFENRRALPPGIASKILTPAVATGATSVVAGVASGIFAAYHFNNTAPFGLVGNILALPVISILVMPFAVLSLLLMPLNLDWLPLQIMGLGVFLVRQIASFVASFSPDGNPGVMPAATLVLWTLALVIAVVFTTRLRILALPFVAAGLIIFIRTPLPDILVSEDAKFVAVRLADGNFAVNRNRPPKFTATNWQTAYLIDRFIPPQSLKEQSSVSSEDAFVCEQGLCTIALRDGRMLAYTADEAMKDVACNIGDIVVLGVAGKKINCQGSSVLMISRQELALKGTLELRLGDRLPLTNDALTSSADQEATSEKIIYRFASPQLHHLADYSDQLSFSVDAPTRPWHIHRLYSREARGLPDRKYQKKTNAKTSYF
ncbi:ComEC/Rec2 family competence protein [Brucella gallinifaecis]|uniref:ComEC/Rec2 family competence protein n=1 Tax=Brucella gallinifaecis TaxID=215590 RepID=A0A502BRG3_9HYPH|nr:ComEC/Rec2 family competence protein [Brucella gallinifaecis]TPF75748.1 ComEC/Rec2 family competence protein [Brucella gallinifaecis]